MNTMNRTDILNYLIDKYGYESYLEIGVRNPADNLDKIKCKSRTGVDPKLSKGREGSQKQAGLFVGTSDDFFAANASDPADAATFDIVFVDGLHTFAQSLKDTRAAFKCLNKGGVVVLHDCLPVTVREGAEKKPKGGSAWCGDVYRTYMKYRCYKGYSAYLVNADHGVGIIKKEQGQDFDLPKGMRDYTLEQFLAVAAHAESARAWLDLITPNQFLNRL